MGSQRGIGGGRQDQRSELYQVAAREALEALGVPVYLMDPSGNLLISSRHGQKQLQKEPALAEAFRRGEIDLRRFLVRPLAEFPGHALVIQKMAHEPLARVASAARRWSLTPRQTEVLHLLLEGQGNRNIAVRLGCAEKTVEVHVGKILARSGLSNRAAVISHLLQER